MDNRLFNVNGRTKEQLLLAVKLLLLDEYGKQTKVKGYYFHQKKGLVLTWFLNDNGSYKPTPFTNRMGRPEEIGSEELTDILWEWKDGEQAKEVELGDWENDADHDGSNDIGWRLYTERWGHIESYEHTIDHYSIAAFKRVYLWYGK